MKPYYKLRSRSLLYYYYVYVDTSDHLGLGFFADQEVRVWLDTEIEFGEGRYSCVFCKIRKRDEERFVTALAKLPAKMLLTGHTDYGDHCYFIMSRAYDEEAA